MKLLRIPIAAAAMLAAGAALADEITVWDWKSGDPATANSYAKAKSDFEAAHPGATVNFVTVGWPEFAGADGGLYAIPLSIQGFVVYYN